MDRKAIEQVFSTERLEPYLRRHNGNFEKALEHYKANIEISESFYPGLSILEIGLRNNLNYQLQRRFKNINWSLIVLKRSRRSLKSLLTETATQFTVYRYQQA